MSKWIWMTLALSLVACGPEDDDKSDADADADTDTDTDTDTDSDTDTDADSDTDTDTDSDTDVSSADVQAIVNSSCAPCHISGTSGGMSLIDVNDQVGTASGQVPSLSRIEAGAPDDSYLWHKINGTQASVGGSGDQMPKGMSPLSTSDLAVIEAWILAGAPQ